MRAPDIGFLDGMATIGAGPWAENGTNHSEGRGRRRASLIRTIPASARNGRRRGRLNRSAARRFGQLPGPGIELNNDFVDRLRRRGLL